MRADTGLEAKPRRPASTPGMGGAPKASGSRVPSSDARTHQEPLWASVKAAKGHHRAPAPLPQTPGLRSDAKLGLGPAPPQSLHYPPPQPADRAHPSAHDLHGGGRARMPGGAGREHTLSSPGNEHQGADWVPRLHSGTEEQTPGQGVFQRAPLPGPGPPEPHLSPYPSAPAPAPVDHGPLIPGAGRPGSVNNSPP